MTALIQFINHFATIVLAAVINSVPVAFALTAIVLIALRLTRANAALRHTAWWAVLAVVITAPFILLFAPKIRTKAPATVLQQSVVVSSQINISAVRPAAPESYFAVSPRNSAARPELSLTNQPEDAAILPASRLAFPIEIHAGKLPLILFSVWLAIFLLLSARVVYSYANLRRLRNSAAPAPPEVAWQFSLRLKRAGLRFHPRILISSEIASPLAAGFFHLVVIVPDQVLARVSAAELDNILLHELAHFARRDNWTNLLARLAACVSILHPVAAFALTRIEREREIACDDWAIAISGSARQYAATLAHLFEVCGVRRRELLATGMANRASRLGERIEMVLRPNRVFASRTSLARLVLSAVAGLAVLIAAAQSPRWIALAQSAPIPPTPPAAPIAPRQPIPPAAPITAVPPIVGVEPLPPTAATPGIAPTEPRPPIPSIEPLEPTAPIPATPPLEPTAPLAPTPSLAPIPPMPPVQPDSSWQDWVGAQSEWSIARSSESANEAHFSFGYHQNNSRWIETNDVELSSLRDFSLSLLDHDGPIKFEYVREAGELVCVGQVRNGRASGTFTVSANQDFVSALEKMGYSTPDEHDVVSLMMSDITLEFARDVKSTGLQLTVADLAELRGHGVSADYIRQARQAGLTQLTADDFCELRTHGVEPQYLQRVLAADPKLSSDDISQLRTHGVEPDYLKGMLATGLPLSMDDICTLRTHGVEPTYFQAIHAANPKLSIDDITELRTHGAEPEYVRGIESVDPQLTPEEISQLRTHGVDPDYLKGILATGIHLTIDEICDLRTHGVEPDYYKEITSADPKLTVDDITNLRTHGVEPDYYRQVKSIDPKLTVDEITRLRTHGADPSEIKGLRSAVPGISIDDLVELSQHGVPASFVAETTREGYHFTSSELAELYSHGIDAGYLRDLQEMGMKNLTAQQILKLRGIS
jgi:beta-lactamase regulating signal transducer with metallopeptidase domain